ncbi:MAG: prepilin-type N-terminal cleavage/methylation domain-containing protein [Phycisphaeraceae bacterium]|nr:prepilin-type N-terminal cleavage/methylation domain-containing protein [Phycisphaeraceae bacterium]MCB9847793.1 prepilin-type N-terminal cleavage/methylation domain-containing protein [Phycisphaeraceae bacterium]
MRPRRGFTLVELMVTISIMAMLIGILTPAIRGAVESSRSFKCSMSMRNVAFDFRIFADDRFHGDRGDDAALGNQFLLETFQEAQYGIDEFWSFDNPDTASLMDSPANDRMQCPSVSGEVTLRSHAPCSGGAVGPAENVSYGFNIRLHKAEVASRRGRLRLDSVKLSSNILNESDVPLAIDVDGKLASAKRVTPVFTGPSLGTTGPLGGDRYWFPGSRHGGSANISFIDGHVASFDDPLAIDGQGWGYQTIH